MVLLAAIVYTPRRYEPVQYVDRQNGNLVTEQIPGEKWLLWLYGNPVGELTLEALAKRKFVSELYGRIMDSPRSKKKIAPFIREYHIDTSICQKKDYKTFNDFFTRRLKPAARPVDRDSLVIVSPADGKLMAYPYLDKQDFIIKGIRFNLYSFLRDSSLARKYDNGSMVMIRLAPTDYHRFHFPVNGTVISEKPVKGFYYSVNPIALRKKIYLLWENRRDYTLIATIPFDTVVMAEVGAAMVGNIIQTYHGNKVVKGEEKGYFKFGGSTIVLLFKPHILKIDHDLVINTSNNLETAVHMGERIGAMVKRSEPLTREAGTVVFLSDSID
ncbi:MAG TPA: phosphatidylserine decarboxylase [Bacteroidetes bacterium]|nr:phosphatidylserine decarboxylase [Bacteroidota bacterium]